MRRQRVLVGAAHPAPGITPELAAYNRAACKRLGMDPARAAHLTRATTTATRGSTVTAAPNHDQDQAAAAAAQLDPDAQLDLLDRELTRRRREREAEGERAKATAYTCSRCGAGESWRAGRGVWFHDEKGAICQACDLDRRSFQRPDGAIIGDSEHRARMIAELVGPELARYQWPPLLVARARELLP